MSKPEHTFMQRLLWPGLCYLLMGISVTLMTITLTLATTDQSFGVEDDYYAKAISWDTSSAERAASEQLGWSLEVRLSPWNERVGTRNVTLLLSDAAGDPVDAEPVDIVAFHHARRSSPRALRIERIAPGRYSGAGALEREGLWQFRVRFTRAGDVYVSTQDVSTTEGGPR